MANVHTLIKWSSFKLVFFNVKTLAYNNQISEEESRWNDGFLLGDVWEQLDCFSYVPSFICIWSDLGQRLEYGDISKPASIVIAITRKSLGHGEQLCALCLQSSIGERWEKKWRRAGTEKIGLWASRKARAQNEVIKKQCAVAEMGGSRQSGVWEDGEEERRGIWMVVKWTQWSVSVTTVREKSGGTK